MRPFSGWGYLAFTVWALAAGLAATGWRLAALLVTELLFGILWNRSGLRPLTRWRFWILIGAAVALGPWLGWRARPSQPGIDAWWPGLAMGLTMAGRALTVTLAFSLGMSSLSLSDMLAMFDRLNLQGLGLALGVAMNLLATLGEAARATFETIRMRGGLRRPTLALRLFLVTLVSNTLGYGDQVVNAAAVRGFDPAAGRGRPLAAHPVDFWLIAALVVLGAAMLVL